MRVVWQSFADKIIEGGSLVNKIIKGGSLVNKIIEGGGLVNCRLFYAGAPCCIPTVPKPEWPRSAKRARFRKAKVGL